MERWRKIVVAGIILVYVVIPALYFLPVLEGTSMQLSEVLDCWKINVEHWLGINRIWKPSEEYVLENYNPYRASIILSNGWYTDGELFYRKGKLGLLFLRVTDVPYLYRYEALYSDYIVAKYGYRFGPDFMSICRPFHVIEDLGNGKYRVRAYVPKVETLEKMNSEEWERTRRDCFIKKSEELEFSVVVEGFEIPLGEMDNESLQEYLGKIMFYSDREYGYAKGNATLFERSIDGSEEPVLTDDFEYWVVELSREDSKLIREIADQVRHYAEELGYNRSQMFVLAETTAVAFDGPYNIAVHESGTSYILKRTVFRGDETREARIVAKTYIGNEIINGGVCQNIAEFEVALLRALGFDAYVFVYGNHADVSINPKDVDISYVIRMLKGRDIGNTYAVLRASFNGTVKEAVDISISSSAETIKDHHNRFPDYYTLGLYPVEIK